MVVRSVLWTGATQYWLFGLGIIKTIILARLVPPEYFGILAIGQAWVTYLTIFRFDFRTAIMAWKETPALLSVQFWLESLMSTWGVLIAVVLYHWVPGILFLIGDVPPMWLSAVWICIFALLGLSVLEAVTSTPRYLAEKHLRQDVIGRLTFAHSLIGFGLATFLASRGHFLAALLADVVIPSVIIGAGVSIVVRWRPALYWSWSLAKKLISFGFTMWTSGLLGKITFQFDDWLVGTIERPRARVWMSSGILPESFYFRAYTAGKMPMDVFAGMIGHVALPIYSRTQLEGQKQLRRVHRHMTWALTHMIFLSATFALIATEEVVTIVLGARWMDTVPLFRMMALYIVARPFWQNCTQLLLAVGREKSMRRTVAVQAIFILIACPPAVWFWGAAGAAVVVSIMALIGWMLSERFVAEVLGAYNWSLYLVPGLTAIFLGILAIAEKRYEWIPSNIWLSTTIKLTSCVLGFGFVTLALERETLMDSFNALRLAITKENT